MFVACRSYLVLAPKTVRRGADLTVSVSIFRASSNVVVRGELKDTRNDLLVSNSTTVASGDLLSFQIAKISFADWLLMFELS